MFDHAYNKSVKLFVSSATSDGEPLSYREATHSENPQSPYWIKAIKAELKSLEDHGTWKIVPKPKKGYIISCKWVWRIKTNADSSVERYKARLVACGFSQSKGINFNKIFAPVTRLDTLRLLVANAVQHNWEFRQIDVKTAYLYGELEDKVYMDVPGGLEGMPENHVLKLEKALYGLKQVGQQWYHKRSGVMDKFGMKHVKSNPHTFMTTKVVRGKKLTLIIPIYMDDLFPFCHHGLFLHIFFTIFIQL